MFKRLSPRLGALLILVSALLSSGCESKTKMTEQCKKGCADSNASFCANDTSDPDDCKKRAAEALESCQKHCEKPF